MAVRTRHRPWKVGFVLLVLAAVAVWFVLSMGWQDRLRAVVMEEAAGPVHVEQPAPEEPSQSGLLQAQATAKTASTMVSTRLASTVSSTAVPTPILSAAPTADSERTRILIPSRAPVPTAMPAAPTPHPTFTPGPEPVLPPHLRHIEEKQHALGLINAERMKAGIGPLSFGSTTQRSFMLSPRYPTASPAIGGPTASSPTCVMPWPAGIRSMARTDTAWITV